MKIKTPAHQQANVPDPDTLLESIGGFETTIPIDPKPPGEDPVENELWIRRRAVLTRTFYRYYPEHDKALSCVIDYWLLLTSQPHLFLNVRDEIGDEPFKAMGGCRSYDFTNSRDVEEWQQAYDRIEVEKLAEADRLIANYSEHAIAYWAHDAIIWQCQRDVLDFDTEHQDIDDLRRIFEQLLSFVKDFLKYKKVVGKPKDSERYPGHFEHVTLKVEQSLIFAVQKLAHVGRTDQKAYLLASEELFPNSEELHDLRKRIEAVDQPFELSFTDLHSGLPIDIHEYRGDVVLLDFWATWCKPCLDFIPFLKNLLNREEHRGLKIVGISCDMARSSADNTSKSLESQSELESLVLKCAKSHGVDWPLFIDNDVHKEWLVKSIPTIFAIDRRGILRSTNARETLNQTVEDLLNE